MKRLSLLVTLACITTSTFAQTVNYGSSGLNQTSTTQPILFKNNGTEKVRIGSDGNVGIGTNAPTEKLEVIGNLKVSGTITSSSSSPMVINNLRTGRIQALAGDSIIKIGDSTLVTLTSFAKLYNDETSATKGIAIGRGVSPGATRARGANSVAVGYNVETTSGAINSVVIGSNYNGSSFLTNSQDNTLMVGFNSNIPTLFVGKSNGLNTTGNVGIGTTSTYAALTIKNGLAIDAGEQNDGTLNINSLKFGSSNTGEGIASKRTDGGNRYGLDFYTSSTNRMSIKNDGNVGIGTSNPSEKLDVRGNTIINENKIYLRTGTDHNHGLGWYTNVTGDNTNHRFTSDNSDKELDGPVLFGFGGGALGSTNGQIPVR